MLLQKLWKFYSVDFSVSCHKSVRHAQNVIESMSS